MNNTVKNALREVLDHIHGPFDMVCNSEEHILQILHKHGIHLIVENEGFSKAKDGKRPAYSVHHDDEGNVRVKLA